MDTVAENFITEKLPDTTRGLVMDILQAARGEDSAFANAAAFGAEWYVAERELVALARELARIGRLLEDRAEDRGAIRLAIDEASARAVEGYLAAGRGRRDRWLSHYSHDMRNALNTLVNAHWILRNTENKRPERVFDMAERAVRRLEASIKEFRELEAQARKPAPGRPDP